MLKELLNKNITVVVKLSDVDTIPTYVTGKLVDIDQNFCKIDCEKISGSNWNILKKNKKGTMYVSLSDISMVFYDNEKI